MYEPPLPNSRTLQVLPQFARRKRALIRGAARPDENEGIQPCAICYVDNENGIGAKIPGCKHQLHVNSAKKWLERSACTILIFNLGKTSIFYQ